MITLILFLIVGGAMVYVAQNNLIPVTLHVGPYSFSEIPLFYIIIGSLLTGLCIAWLIYIVNSIITSFKLRGKDKEIKEASGEVVELTKRIHQLELENEKLKNGNDQTELIDTNAL